ncbi:hypothetical protein TNCV_4805021 [Trichonephila clavipes]|nr:hypothetical protein TNCV_4805021 [Trichonephila clavipes]
MILTRAPCSCMSGVVARFILDLPHNPLTLMDLFLTDQQNVMGFWGTPAPDPRAEREMERCFEPSIVTGALRYCEWRNGEHFGPPTKSGFGARKSSILQRVGTWQPASFGPPGIMSLPQCGGVSYATGYCSFQGP